mmetsp:Transcript_11842/g.19945  ORF Transcript_11842/g.19945 Transcript_11842/m.19945 type:complete len:495 (-) Transcript_11842:96-1580(-)
MHDDLPYIDYHMGDVTLGTNRLDIRRAAAAIALLVSTCVALAVILQPSLPVARPVLATASHPDRVRALPNAPPLDDAHFAGRLPATADGSAHLFYWLVMAKTMDSPLIIWLNGGPGASSLTGLLFEGIGPLLLQPNGTLIRNAFSWTRLANVVAFEQPVGVGYSYSSTSPPSYASSLEEAAEQLVAALLALYDRHPGLRTAPLYLTGESFAGKYLPFTANAITAFNDRQSAAAARIPLSGLAIGNGVLMPLLQYTSILDFAAAWGFLPEQPNLLQQLRDSLASCEVLLGERRWQEAYQACQYIEDHVYNGAVPFVYDVREPIDRFSQISVFMSEYLSRADVREALHVGESGPAVWKQMDGGQLGNDVGDHLGWEGQISDLPRGMLEGLISRYRLLFYSGNADGSMCNQLGGQRVLRQLSGPAAVQRLNEQASRCTWTVGGMPAGVARSGSADLAALVVLHAGHLVPMNVPKAALEMVRLLLSGESFENAFCTKA